MPSYLGAFISTSGELLTCGWYWSCRQNSVRRGTGFVTAEEARVLEEDRLGVPLGYVA